MLKAPISLSKSVKSDEDVFFTFWDMDDTSIRLLDNVIKNAHLMLPILLFQTRAANQHIGIITNRTPTDTETSYSVKQYVNDLAQFGIHIPHEHLIFAGGTNGSSKTEDFHRLEQAMAIINAQLETLHVTEEGNKVASQVKLALDGLIQTKYHGKNYHLTKFLNEHFDSHSQTYSFVSGTCSKAQLQIGMVDDLDKIADAMSCLGGQNFFGVKASRGGNPPKIEQPEDDYYRDDYLILLAKRIGLALLASDILDDRLVHIEENAMLHVAVLLYAWHIVPMQSLSPFQLLAKYLTGTECEQVANMLAYIKMHANCHPNAHYVPVDELYHLFQCMADQTFLRTVGEQLLAIKQQRLRAKPQASLTEPPIKAELSRGSRLGKLFKANSHKIINKETKASATTSTNSIARPISQSELLDEEETRIIKRLLVLKDSKEREIAAQAFLLLQENGIESHEFIALETSLFEDSTLSTSLSTDPSPSPSPILSSIPDLDVSSSLQPPPSQWTFPSRALYAQQGGPRLSLVASSSTPGQPVQSVASSSILGQTAQDDSAKEDKDKDKKDKKSGRKK